MPSQNGSVGQPKLWSRRHCQRSRSLLWPTKCPLTAAINAIGGKWSLICLYWLHSGTRRFNELHRLMPDISHKVLTETLRNLEQHGLIERKVYAQVPPRVEYRISTHGESVLPILQAVRAWGHDHILWDESFGRSKRRFSSRGQTIKSALGTAFSNSCT